MKINIESTKSNIVRSALHIAKKSKKIAEQAVSGILSGLMIMSGLGSYAVSDMINAAYASDSVYVTNPGNGGKIYYGKTDGLGSNSTMYTRKYTATIDGSTYSAWCGEPDKTSPTSGTYSLTSLKSSSTAAKVMYYGWVGPSSIQYWNVVSKYSSLSNDGRYIVVHTAFSKALGNNWSKGLSDYGKQVTNDFYSWVEDQDSIPDSTDVWFERSGKEISTKNTTYTAAELFDDSYFSNIKSFPEIQQMIDNGYLCTTGISLKTDNDTRTMTLQLPEDICAVIVKTGSAPRKIISITGFGDTITVPADNSGSYYYNFVLDPEKSGTTKTKLKLSGSATAKNFKAYKIKTNTKSSTQVLGTILTETDQSSATLTINWDTKAYIEISKINDEQDPIEGATFDIFDEEGNVIAESAKTEADGTFDTDALDPGTYTVVEKSVPAPYAIDTEPRSVTVSAGETKAVTFYDSYQLGSVILRKMDSLSGDPVSVSKSDRAKYEIMNTSEVTTEEETTDDRDTIFKTYKAGEYVREVYLNSSGSSEGASVDGLPIGTYTLKETEPAKGYVLDDSTYTITVSHNKSSDVADVSVTDSDGKKVTASSDGSIQVEDRPVMVHIKVVKKDAETGNTVLRKGATFTIYSDKACTRKVETISTDSSGEAVSGLLRNGVYYIKEDRASHAYVTDSSTVVTADVSISSGVEDGETYSFTFKDDRTLYTLNVRKIDNDTGNNNPQGDATLEGTVFGLYAAEDIYDPSNNGDLLYKEDDLVCRMTTDAEGKASASASDLYEGSYYLSEISNPEGYRTNVDKVSLKFEWDNGESKTVEYSTTFEEDVKYGFIALTKFVKNTNKSQVEVPEEGIHFRIMLESYVDEYGSFEDAWEHRYDEDVTAKEWCEIITDSEGYAETSELAYGDYIVHQSTSGDDTEDVNDFEVSIRPEDDEPVTRHYAVSNEELSAFLKITKIDAESGKTVLRSGTKYKVKALSDVTVDNKSFSAGDYIYYKSYALSVLGFDIGSSTVDEWTTNSRGYIILNEKLGAGNYLLEEVTAPDRYVKGQDVEFSIHSDGVYEMDEDEDYVITVEQEDVPAKGIITVEKRGEVLTDYDEDEHRFIYEETGLPGAVFDIIAREDIMDPSNDGTILYAEGSIVEQIVTDEDGLAVSSRLPLGEYTVRESTAPEGMVLNEEDHDISLVYDGQEVEVVYEDTSFVNERRKVSVEAIKKSVNTEELLDGAEIVLYANKDVLNCRGEVICAAGTEIERITTSADGAVEFTADLPIDLYSAIYASEDSRLESDELAEDDYGDISDADVSSDIDPEPVYNITDEIIESIDENGIYESSVSGESANGDQESGSSKDVSITLEDGVYVVEVDYSNWTGSDVTERHITYYVDEDGYAVEPTIVLDENGDVIEETMEKTDVEGVVVSSTPDSLFAIKEVDPPLGYQLEELVYPVDTSYEDSETVTIEVDRTFRNEPSITHISKTDVLDDHEVENAFLKIYDEEGNVVDEWMSDDEEHVIEALEMGETYTLVESVAPDGYSYAEAVEFTVSEDGSDTYVDMDEDHTHVSISKVDVTGDNEIPGARLQILDKDGNVVEEWTSTEEAHIIEGVLDAGEEYILHEEVACEGYVTANDVAFEVNMDGTVTTVEMVDKQVIFSKKDVTGQVEVPGAHIVVTDEDGQIVDEWDSMDEDHPISGLVEGHTYTLTETQAPDGYVMSESIEFTVSDEKTDEYIEMYDKQVFMSKTDVTGESELEGAHIVVTEAGGNIIDEWDSTTEEHAINGLTEGKTYTLTETLAPDDYAIASSIEFTVSTDKMDEHLTMVDKLVSVSKLDIVDSSEVVGATLEVSDRNGNVIDEWITTEEEHYISGLQEGETYTLTERIPANGYACAESIEFTVNDDKTVDRKIVMYDAPYTSVEIVKIDSDTQETITGKDFEFTLYSDKDCEDDIAVADGDISTGTALFEDLALGTYYAKETAAPEGYDLSSEKLEITIDEYLESIGSVYSLTFEDSPEPTTAIGQAVNNVSKAVGAAADTVADTVGDVIESVRTGDVSYLLIAAVAVLAVVAVAVIIIIIKKRSRNRIDEESNDDYDDSSFDDGDDLSDDTSDSGSSD